MSQSVSRTKRFKGTAAATWATGLNMLDLLLVVWLVGAFVGWLAGWRFGSVQFGLRWLADSLVGLPVARLAGWLLGWLTT